MPTLAKDVNIDRGVDYPDLVDPAQYTWKQGSSAATATLVDLTGYTAVLNIRASRDATTQLLTLTNGSGITLGGVAGTIRWALTPTQTSSLSSGDYYYELILTALSGQKYLFVAGTAHFR